MVESLEEASVQRDLPVVVIFLLQGHPHIVCDEEGEIFTLPDFETAQCWAAHAPASLLTSAERAWAFNCDTGESEGL